MVRLVPALAAVALTVASLSGCGGGTAEPGNAADATFLQDMLPHHMQAVMAGRLAATMGTDPRVIAFGKRIVAEQTPEIMRMQAMTTTLKLTLDSSRGNAMAVNEITPAALQQLAAEPAPQRDHDLLVRSAESEQGAVTMARAELAGGRFAPARTLATSIASAANPGSEIAQLDALARQLPV